MSKSNLLERDEQSDRTDPVRYEFALADSPAQVREAQQLRHAVFTAEWGAVTSGPDGVDRDDWDDRAEHLLVRAVHERTGRAPVVATYRLLPPHAYAGAGDRTMYLASEFDLGRWAPMVGSLVEAGRACVHPDHRTATPIALLWGGIARYMHLTGYRYLAGGASISLADGGGQAAAFAELARLRYWAPPEWRCRPLREVAAPTVVPPRVPALPPLLGGYVRLGAKVCGDPAFDPAFNSADFPVLLDMEAVDRRYLDRFLAIGARP